jgi:FkbM family methyltransferase
MGSNEGFYTATNMYGAYCVPASSAYTYTSRTILAGKVHEPKTIKYIIDHCKNRDIIHAGAGFGDFLPALSKNCSGQIFSFEPNNENYACAQKTVELNGLRNVRLFNSGLGEKKSVKYLKITEGGLSLGPRTETTSEPSLKDGLQECEIYALDDVIENPNVSIIHLDTEGYEFNILKGAKNIIDRCKPLIILEIDSRALYYNEFMHSIGYTPKKQLIYNARKMVFVNTVYSYNKKITPLRQP